MKRLIRNSPMERTSPVPSGERVYLKASATVEALMIIPIVLIFVYSFIWLMDVIRIHSTIGAIVSETGKECVMLSPANGGEKETDILKTVGSAAVSEIYLKNRIMSDSVSSEISDLVCLFPDAGSTDEISIDVYYRVEPKIKIPGMSGMLLSNSFYSKAYTGFSKETEVTEYVYITNESEVYHTTTACSSIKTTIQTLAAGSLKTSRNKDGGKYYPCTKCVDKETNEIVYVTPYGNRYHNDADCPELRIRIYRIPISEIGGRRGCSFCK